MPHHAPAPKMVSIPLGQTCAAPQSWPAGAPACCRLCVFAVPEAVTDRRSSPGRGREWLWPLRHLFKPRVPARRAGEGVFDPGNVARRRGKGLLNSDFKAQTFGIKARNPQISARNPETGVLSHDKPSFGTLKRMPKAIKLEPGTTKPGQILTKSGGWTDENIPPGHGLASRRDAFEAESLNG